MATDPIRSNWRDYALYATMPVVLTLVMGGTHLRAVLDGGLLNPDSYMRLVRLAASLDAGSALHVVARDASGSGTVLHWSHLLDSALVLLAMPFRLWMDWHHALHIAGMLSGPLGLGGLGLAIAWAAIDDVAALGRRRLGPFLLSLAPAITPYGLLGVVHHHVLVVLIGVVSAGLAARIVTGLGTARSAILLGAWAALGVWLTPESVPLSVLAFGALWFGWLTAVNRRTDMARAIRTTGLSFLLGTVAAFLADPPMAGYGVSEIDRLSRPCAGLASAIAATGCAIVAIDRHGAHTRQRLILSAAAGTVFALTWLLCFPSILPGSAPLLADTDWQAFFGDIAEMKPVYGAAALLQHLATGAFAASVLAVLAARERSWVLGYAAVAVLLLLAAGQAHVRFAAYPEAAGALLLPVAIGVAQQRWEAPWKASLCRLAVLMAFVAVPGLASLPALARPAAAAAEGSLAMAAGLLGPHAGQTVLAEVNDTPELLYRAPVRTVGSLYHRNPGAFLRLRAAWRSGPSTTLPAEVAASGADLLLFRPSQVRSLLVADLPTETLIDRLNQGDVPAWLVPVDGFDGTGHQLFWIVRR